MCGWIKLNARGAFRFGREVLTRLGSAGEQPAGTASGIHVGCLSTCGQFWQAAYAFPPSSVKKKKVIFRYPPKLGIILPSTGHLSTGGGRYRAVSSEAPSVVAWGGLGTCKGKETLPRGEVSASYAVGSPGDREQAPLLWAVIWWDTVSNAGGDTKMGLRLTFCVTEPVLQHLPVKGDRSWSLSVFFTYFTFQENSLTGKNCPLLVWL